MAALSAHFAMVVLPCGVLLLFCMLCAISRRINTIRYDFCDTINFRKCAIPETTAKDHALQSAVLVLQQV